MTVDVSGVGTVLQLGDGEHRVRFSTESLIAVEDLFPDGFMGVLQAFGSRPVKTSVAVLEVAEIDGGQWGREQIASALKGVAKLEIANKLQEALFAEMGYTDQSVDPERLEQAQRLMDAGVDPTKPETWTPAALGKALASTNGSTGQGS